jgi:hypothetical protein
MRFGCGFHCSMLDVNFSLENSKMTSKTHLTVKHTSKLHIQYANVFDP